MVAPFVGFLLRVLSHRVRTTIRAGPARGALGGPGDARSVTATAAAVGLAGSGAGASRPGTPGQTRAARATRIT